jgi:hypothetical protein
VIEKPLPLPYPKNGTGGLIAREEKTSYGLGKGPMGLGNMVGLDERSRDHYRHGNGPRTEHVFTETANETKLRVAPQKRPSRQLVC